MLELVADLIKEGAAVNGKTHDGFTSWHYASIHGHLAVVQTLLDHGADVAAKNEDGNTSCTTPPFTDILRWCRCCGTTA